MAGPECGHHLNPSLGVPPKCLAFRLNKCFGLDFTAQDLLAACRRLSPPEGRATRGALLASARGARPGVYLATSQAAIDALLEVYENATDGALLYAERAGNA